jgi:hypothetical protein
MPDEAAENAETAGNSSQRELDIAALFRQLQDEVSRTGPRRAGGDAPSTVRTNARAAAERLWRVTADRNAGGRGGIAKPVKYVVRRLTRWYVEPVFADQRAYNHAALKLIDDLQEQVEALQARIAELEQRQ